MFAVITPALIIGAFAERIKFSSFLIFMLLWATIIYDPVAHWVWGKGGWLAAAGALDFAGGVVVHVNAGVAALVMAFMIGKREGLYADPFTPHNMPHIVLGTALLWFGWFGFNAGSALAANGVAANAFVTTNVAGAAAGLGWTLIEWMHRRAPTMLGAATGAVAGLATVTPAAGFVSPMAAVFIGAAAAGVCYVAVVVLKAKLDLDDSLDVFGVHGVGGILGAMLTGVFASAAVNPAGVDGFLHGNPGQLSIQAVAVLATLAYSGVGTFVLYKVVDLILGMRVDKKAEIIGLDLSQHREAGYTVLE
jgi:Amt family ammonium transporter